jgi:hypothetical protein
MQSLIVLAFAVKHRLGLADAVAILSHTPEKRTKNHHD